MATTSANYVFLPWVRQGIASGIKTIDSLNENQPGISSAIVKLQINNSEDIERKVRLYGPGDVAGIDTQQVIRTEPRHLTMDFEPNYFPAIEFDHPGYPWLFTPAKADELGRLRPWLCLIVVRKQEGVTLNTDSNTQLPVLRIDLPAKPESELPDLSESWAWAHTQIAGSELSPEKLRSALSGDPALTVSRLLCPRRLDPDTAYLACLVPAFELGRRAGLGIQISQEDERSLLPAWKSGSEAPDKVVLPVYYQWEFRTGVGSDFEELAQNLEPRVLPVEAGKLRMDVSNPGFQTGLSSDQDLTIEFEGALRPIDALTADLPIEIQTPFQNSLKEILNTPRLAMNQGGIEPVLAPPIYGCWQAAQHIVEPITSVTEPLPSPPWLHEMNLDPRHRATAALGARVVKSQQEQLMASAWEQLGEIERLNQIKRQAQLGRAVNRVYHTKHFSRFSEETLLKVASVAQSRIVFEANVFSHIEHRAMLSHAISQSALPNRAMSAPLRRMASSRGVISARFQNVASPPIAVIAKLNTTTSIVPVQKKEAGMIILDKVAEGNFLGGAEMLKDFVRSLRILGELQAPPKMKHFNVVSEGTLLTLANILPGVIVSANEQVFVNAAIAHGQYFTQRLFTSFITIPALSKLPDAKSALLDTLDPEKTINARVRAYSETTSGGSQNNDPLEPTMDTPEFPQPMFEALSAISQDFLFPGLEYVPNNTATLLETNTKFVESFMVGLNTEMSSELLWRNFPTDQRGTYFRHFWGGGDPDIRVISEWGNSELGNNMITSEKLVLLIRGDLLRRYPNSAIYAVKSINNDLSTDPDDQHHPMFRGGLKPDVTFLGFDLSREDVVADAGFFFVIQQQPTEPRFGLDEADFSENDPPLLTTWDDLNWRHIANSSSDLKMLSHLSIKTSQLDINNNKAKWGRNSAHQAYITLQHPVRIAIHARDMITTTN